MESFVKEIQPLPLVDLTGGLNETDNIDSLQPNEATFALNVECSRGTLQKRSGSIQLAQQIDAAGVWSNARIGNWAFHFRARDGSNYILAVWNDKLFILVGDTWVGAISGTFSGNASDTFGGGGDRLGTSVQYVDKIYYMDGVLAKRYTHGAPSTITNWSFQGGTMTAPVLSAAAPGGALGLGAYTAVYTLRDTSTGDETSPSATSNPISAVVNDRIPIAIAQPAGYTSNYNKVRIYRTVVNGAGAWFFEKEVNATFPISDFLSVADNLLGAEVEYDNDPVPAGRYVVWHNERAVVSGVDASPSTVYWSKQGKPWSFPAANATDLRKDDGHPVTGLLVFQGFVYAGKRGGPIFQLAPHQILGYAQQQLAARHGIESHWSIVQDEFSAYWADKDGFIRFNGQQTENVSDAKIRRTFRDLAAASYAYLPRVFGIHNNQPDRPSIQWFFSTTTTGIKDYSLVFNLRNSSWQPHRFFDRGQRVAFRYEDPSTRREWVYTVDGNGYLRRLRTNTSSVELFSDNNTGAIEFKWYSSWLGAGVDHSMLHWIDVEFEKSVATKTVGQVDFFVWADGDESQPVVRKQFKLYDSGPLTKVVRFNMPARHWKRFRIGFAHNFANGDLSVVKVIPYFSQIGMAFLGARG